MNNENIEQILSSLSKSHSNTSEIVKNLDPDLCVYKNSGWRIRDIIGHLSTWNNEVIKSLDAYNLGQEYSIPDLGDEVDFNEKEVIEQKKHSSDQIMENWELAHKNLIKTVKNLPVDKFPGDLLYPWGDERGTVENLLQFMIDHNIEHIEEILKTTNFDQ